MALLSTSWSRLRRAVRRRRQKAAVGTIVAKNFVSFARVLAQSLREHNPALPFFVVLADRVDGLFTPADEPFEIVLLDDLGIPDLQRLRFRYSRQQLSIVAKPYLLRYLLNRGFTTAVFLDADILVTDSLQPLIDETSDHAIAITPHLLAPLPGTDRSPRELNILQSGTYNGGFVGVSRHASAERFLDWWADRLHTHCWHDVEQAMHYDQRWLDLVPALFDGVHVVRDAGCNVAYWNLPERDLRMTPDGARAGDGPCRFFHFSGFEPEHPDVVTRYSGRLTMDDIGAAAALFARYVVLLQAHGHFESRNWQYSFGAFDNGVPIPAIARRIYQEMGAAAGRFGDPFGASGTEGFFHWLNEPADGQSGTSAISRLWTAVYNFRPDVQQTFPDIMAADRAAFREWTVTSGLEEHGIDEAFAPRGPSPEPLRRVPIGELGDQITGTRQ